MGFFSRPAVLAPKEPRSLAERDLVRRLDIFLLGFGCLSQVIKYLDQTNISNAYVSGMKQDLELYGNELNYFTTYFNIAFCIMLIPSQIILTHVRPSLWLSGLEIGWGVITGLMAMTTRTYQVYILRVFLGLFESSAWPGMMSLLMHWYTPGELAKRMGFYHSCQAIGSMMSGALQAAIMGSMDGRFGLAGWRWLFVINAIITVIWGCFGFVLLPDYPNKPNPWAFWFNKTHGEMAMTRLLRHKRAEPKKISLTGVVRTFSSWVVYFITILYVGTVLATYGNVYFSLFLKAATNGDGTPRWTTVQVNAIPIGGYAINVVFVWFWAILSDVLQTRWALIIAQCLINFIPAIAMTVWTSHPSTTSITTAYASYFIAYIPLGTAPLIFAWLSDTIPHDPEARTLIVGVAVAFYYAISAWSQVLVWPAAEAPYYTHGWQTSIGLTVLVIVMTSMLRFIDVRYLKPQREAFGDLLDAQAEEERVRAEKEGRKSFDN
ncbi:retrograde regulation protein 2 [Thozetella sp. PMI_491]|nr:retrograde regulation protein 2 [Thozetella sp. PMI_491]